ncbi:MAG: hypothetical protein J5825_00600 [Lachnospiraceae bacterium]|nr:hypothetical protein [Lachnospiraceae bacterium]
MGYGSYNARDWSKLKQSKNISATSSENEIFVRNEINPKFDPKFINTREARDSEDHPNSTPIIIGLDVTASMGYLAREIASTALNETMMKLYSTKAIEDPALMFAAYGDYSDVSPLQVTQFESDIRVAEQLMDLWLEFGGYGMVVPELLWYFAAKHTTLDAYEKRKKKGFLFTIGDDADLRPIDDLKKTWDNALSYEKMKEVFGEDVPKSMTLQKIVKEASEKFEIFHISIPERGSSDPLEFFESVIPGRVFTLKGNEYQMLPEILISIMQVTNGADKETVINSWDEMKRATVKRILQQLPQKGQKGIVF